MQLRYKQTNKQTIKNQQTNKQQANKQMAEINNKQNGTIQE